MNVSPTPSTPAEIQEILARARRLQASENFSYAETLCANVLRAQPAEHAARMILRACQNARYYQKHGSFKPAKTVSSISFFATKAGADPLKDAEQAEQALKDNPCDLASNQLLQQAARRLGWADIEQLCLDQIAEGSPTPENIIARAAGLRNHREFDRALAILGKGQRQYPGNMLLEKALLNMQAVAAAEGGWENAKTFLDVTKTIAPENDVQALVEKIEQEPRTTALVDQLILILERSGQDAEALTWIDYRRQIEENPALRRKALEIRRRLGTLTPEEELLELEAFVKQQPVDLELRLNLGTALLRQGNAAAAIPHLQRARRNGKIASQVEAILALAEAYDLAGLSGLGEKSRNHALEIACEDESLQKEILYRMAKSLQSQGRAEESRSRWLELFEIDAEYKDVAAQVLGATGTQQFWCYRSPKATTGD